MAIPPPATDTSLLPSHYAACRPSVLYLSRVRQGCAVWYRLCVFFGPRNRRPVGMVGHHRTAAPSPVTGQQPSQGRILGTSTSAWSICSRLCVIWVLLRVYFVCQSSRRDVGGCRLCSECDE